MVEKIEMDDKFKNNNKESKNNNENEKKIIWCGISDAEIKGNIWGFFYPLTSGIFQLEEVSEDASSTKKTLTWLPLLITVIILFVRALSVGLKMNNCIVS